MDCRRLRRAVVRAQPKYFGQKAADAMNYVTLSDEEKLALLQEHSLNGDWPDLDHKQWCLHCESEFDGRFVRVWKDEEGELWLECGNPGCDGSPIDWAEFPWWDPDHPLTKKHAESNGDDDDVPG